MIQLRAHVCLLAPLLAGTKIKIDFLDHLAANAALSADLGNFFGERGEMAGELGFEPR